MIEVRGPVAVRVGGKWKARWSRLRRRVLNGQRLRLISGLVLFAFVLTHFLNHALGIVSVRWMEDAQVWRRGLWQSTPGLVLLSAAAVVHVGLAFSRAIRRRTWRIPRWEAMQLVLGLLIPVLVGGHVLATLGLKMRFGVSDDYGRVLGDLWPAAALMQTLALVVVWLHAMLGLHHWLGGRTWYRRSFPLLVSLAVAIPLLAEWGWVDAARRLDIAGLATHSLPPEAREWVLGGRDTILAALGCALLAAATVFLIRRLSHAGPRSIAVTFPDDRVVRVMPGATLLEIGRMNGIPYASICGGRARCSTCRTRVTAGADRLPSPNPAEQAVLERIHADPSVRLACQMRPTADLAVLPLVPAGTAAKVGTPGTDLYHWGVEQTVAILFVDMRNFTGLSEHRLSFDVVFLLNRYLDAMAEAVRSNGGYVDKFIGDGVMAIFGMGDGPAAGCRAALRAAAAMGPATVRLNREFKASLGHKIRIGVGIHVGPAILGRIGAAGGVEAAGITALGDTVNIASRLEAMTKELDAVVVASRAVTEAAAFEAGDALVHEVTVRGRAAPLEVHAFTAFEDLESALAARWDAAISRAAG